MLCKCAPVYEADKYKCNHLTTFYSSLFQSLYNLVQYPHYKWYDFNMDMCNLYIGEKYSYKDDKS